MLGARGGNRIDLIPSIPRKHETTRKTSCHDPSTIIGVHRRVNCCWQRLRVSGTKPAPVLAVRLTLRRPSGSHARLRCALRTPAKHRLQRCLNVGLLLAPTRSSIATVPGSISSLCAPGTAVAHILSQCCSRFDLPAVPSSLVLQCPSHTIAIRSYRNCRLDQRVHLCSWSFLFSVHLTSVSKLLGRRPRCSTNHEETRMA